MPAGARPDSDSHIFSVSENLPDADLPGSESDSELPITVDCHLWPLLLAYSSVYAHVGMIIETQRPIVQSCKWTFALVVENLIWFGRTVIDLIARGCRHVITSYSGLGTSSYSKAPLPVSLSVDKLKWMSI